MDIAVLGIDLGKTVCSLAGVNGAGAVVLRKRVQRFRLLGFLARLAPCVVAMEACGGAHHVGRFCLQFGHEPRLMSPLYVRPYVKVHKNDVRDPALLEMGHALITNRGGTTTRECCPARPSIAALLDAK